MSRDLERALARSRGAPRRRLTLLSVLRCLLLLLSALMVHIVLMSRRAIVSLSASAADRRRDLTPGVAPREVPSWVRIPAPAPRTLAADGFNSRQSQFTVVLNTYRDSLRNPCVIGQWEPLKSIVREVIVVWDLPASPHFEYVSTAALNYSIPVRFETSLGNLHGPSLNNRYRLHENITTDAVFAIDDDIRIRHEGVRRAFEEWRRRPDLVFSYSRHEVERKRNGEYKYGRHWPQNWNMSSTLGVTMAGGTMVHRRYYWLYVEETAAMAHVDRRHNCEDILMNWVVAKDLLRRNDTSSGPAVYLWPYFPVFPPPPNVTVEATGISTRGGHYTHRDGCVRKFVELFGFAITRRNEWSVGWLEGCGLDMPCRFPFEDEPRLNARTCQYFRGSGRDVYE